MPDTAPQARSPRPATRPDYFVPVTGGALVDHGDLPTVGWPGKPKGTIEVEVPEGRHPLVALVENWRARSGPNHPGRTQPRPSPVPPPGQPMPTPPGPTGPTHPGSPSPSQP